MHPTRLQQPHDTQAKKCMGEQGGRACNLCLAASPRSTSALSNRPHRRGRTQSADFAISASEQRPELLKVKHGRGIFLASPFISPCLPSAHPKTVPQWLLRRGFGRWLRPRNGLGRRTPRRNNACSGISHWISPRRTQASLPHIRQTR